MSAASGEPTANDLSASASGFVLSRWLFLRFLALVYLCAFAAILPQMMGLFGEQGIGPAQGSLYAAGRIAGPSACWAYPTIAWINSSDAFLQLIPVAGIFVSLLALAGLVTLPALILCWYLYLSIVTIGGPFLSFQWDALLLEAGFLAMFFAPLQFF